MKVKAIIRPKSGGLANIRAELQRRQLRDKARKDEQESKRRFLAD